MTPSQQKQLNISYLSGNFRNWFGNFEINPNTKKLETKVLPRDMLDGEILSELKPTEITLDDFFGQLEYLDKDEWYIGYIKDKDGVLRAVYVYWDGGGWSVDADSTTRLDEWVAGLRVFSHSCAPSNTEPLKSPLTPSPLDTYCQCKRCEHCGKIIKSSI